jgi:hypothetical protein
MSFDKSEPKTRLISGLAVFTIVSLVLIRYGLISYWNVMRDEEMDRKVNQRPAAQLIRLRDEANQRLSGGAMPIDQAMSTIANGQRPAAISPRPSTDMAPLTGWMQSQQALPTEMPMSPPVSPAPLPTPEMMGDGGAPTTAVMAPTTPQSVGLAAGAPLTPQTTPTAPVHPLPTTPTTTTPAAPHAEH